MRESCGVSTVSVLFRSTGMLVCFCVRITPLEFMAWEGVVVVGCIVDFSKILASALQVLFSLEISEKKTSWDWSMMSVRTGGSMVFPLMLFLFLPLYCMLCFVLPFHLLFFGFLLVPTFTIPVYRVMMRLCFVCVRFTRESLAIIHTYSITP